MVPGTNPPKSLAHHSHLHSPLTNNINLFISHKVYAPNGAHQALGKSQISESEEGSGKINSGNAIVKGGQVFSEHTAEFGKESGEQKEAILKFPGDLLKQVRFLNCSQCACAFDPASPKPLPWILHYKVPFFFFLTFLIRSNHVFSIPHPIPPHPTIVPQKRMVT